MATSTLGSVFESIFDRDDVTTRARALHAFERQRDVRSYDFVLALIRSISSEPERSMAAVRRAWEALTGQTVAPASFDAHFNPGMVRLLWELFEKVTQPVGRSLRRRWPRELQRLRDVLIGDGTRMALDKALSHVFAGTSEGQAGLKLLGFLSLGEGQLTDVRAGAAVHHDRKLLRLGELVEGALYLLDLGFYDHSLFAQYDDAGAFFVSRLKSHVVPVIETIAQGVIGARQAVGKRLDDAQRYRSVVDVDARLSAPDEPEHTRTFRIVKVAVPRTDGHDHWTGEHVDCWYVTNLPRDEWTPRMIAALYRLRWAIEQAWRQAKSLARLDHLRSEKPAVIFIFVAASLLVWALGMVAVRELERERGVGQVSHERVLRVLLAIIPDVTRTLAREPERLRAELRRVAGVFRREGKHPNPGQPRRISTVFETVQFEARQLAEAA